MTTHNEAALNAIADAAAALYDEVSFWHGDTETAIPREALSFSPAGDPGSQDRQVALPGRAWSQMFTVEVPEGVTVDAYVLHGSGVESRRAIPPVTGPRLGWLFSIPVDAVQNP